MRSARLLPVAIAALVLTPAGGAAQESCTLEDVSFLTGCWVGDMGSLILEEQSTAAQGGVMLGTTRFIRDGTVVDWEFGRMVEEDGVVTLWPYPRGTISTDGFPLVRAGAELVFENLAHDFPVRIVYARLDATHLAPRIEGSDGEARGWSLTRAKCPE